MKHKMVMMLSALVLVFVAPTFAFAGEFQVDSKALGEGKELFFTTKFAHGELRTASEPTITCTANTGTGKYISRTTGEITLTFTGCKENVFGSSCTSNGLATGTIKTGTSVFHNVYLTDSKTTPGVLITPPASGVFTTVSCGLFGLTVTGNGIIGHVESPKCGAASPTTTQNFSATGTVQTFRQVTGTGATYSLASTTSGGSPATSAMVAGNTWSFPESITLTCV